LQGFANEKEYMKAAIDAANIYRNCRKKGYTIRKPNDCMIALIALTYKLELLHNDKDFEHIASMYPLKLVKI
jgi:predicted nucleic acid-binding protein